MAHRPLDQSSSLGTLFDFTFNRFITITIVKFLYGLILALIALGWLIAVIGGFARGFGTGVVGLVLFTIIALIYVIGWRVALELVVVIFRIGENTSALVEQKERGSDTEGTPSP